jgi:hypothetical protein
VVDQGQPVSGPLELLQELHELLVVQSLQPTVLDQLDQMTQTDPEGVERGVNRFRTSETHTDMLLECMFDISIVPSQRSVHQGS